MLIKVILFINLLLLSDHNCESQFGGVDMLDAVKQFCLGKSSRNFCSNEQLKVNYEIIRKQQKIKEDERLKKIRLEKMVEEERLKQMKIDQLNKLLMKNARSNYMRDFFAGRYF